MWNFRHKIVDFSQDPTMENIKLDLLDICQHRKLTTLSMPLTGSLGIIRLQSTPMRKNV
jgi:hypothetical protein